MSDKSPMEIAQELSMQYLKDSAKSEVKVEDNRTKLILKNFQSPGDLVLLTACLRDLHKAYPDKYITDVRTPCPDLFKYNPYITSLSESESKVIKMEYPLIHNSNKGGYHFIHGFIDYLSSILNVKIPLTEFKGDIYLSKDEKNWIGQVSEILNKSVPYWIIDAGSKNDFTAKQWDVSRYQEVVDAFSDIYFVQIGAKEHNHKPLIGNNLINLIGKTDLRQLIRLVYNSFGVITPVSLPMHLSAAIEVNPVWKRKSRPCIVIAGGREPSVWEAYTNHQYIHTCGMLDCCSMGGCWQARTVPVGDGDSKDINSLCKYPIDTKSGFKIPKCLDMIKSDDVIQKIKLFTENYNG